MIQLIDMGMSIVRFNMAHGTAKVSRLLLTDPGQRKHDQALL
jgi:pyruvate kinase